MTDADREEISTLVGILAATLDRRNEDAWDLAEQALETMSGQAALYSLAGLARSLIQQKISIEDLALLVQTVDYTEEPPEPAP